ncbi:MAG: hypothetical protein ACI9CF_000991 [Candidatus Omnitrophota bacterium]|jgi:hypothetical protein
MNTFLTPTLYCLCVRNVWRYFCSGLKMKYETYEDELLEVSAPLVKEST